MNKDLDERLVPNGEYRDALNIQVSTSEGSDVGAVQNILGNSLITGQDFIGTNAVCVGSIADEKNDKLYYFVTPSSIEYNGFNASGPSTGWTGEGGVVATYSGNTYEWIDIYLGVLTAGVKYKISFTNTTDVGNPIEVQLGGNHLFILTEGPQVIYITAGGASSDTSDSIRFYSGASNANANARWNGTISNVVVTPQTGSYIIEYDSKTNSTTPVLVDVDSNVLNFDSNNIITGINIIDNILLWTDNVNEPKKINIDRSKAGTDISGLIQTNLIVEGNNKGPIKEEHITVIKKSPSNPPRIRRARGKRGGNTSGNFKQVNYFHNSEPNEGFEVENGDELWIGITHEANVKANPPNIKVGDVLRVYQAYDGPIDGELPVARLIIKEVKNQVLDPSYYGMSIAQQQNQFIDSTIGSSAETSIKVSITDFVKHESDHRGISGPNVYKEYWFELEEDIDTIFEKKFPRFACRYKYQDNEYSTVGPFSEVVFIPSEFKYHPTEAYNQGMINTLKELTLTDFALNIPQDVVAVDLLYKNEFSPNIYVIESVKRNDWGSGNGSYNITTENIYTQLPSNQLIRPWDNVPKTALAQEVTGNRVVYANYTQGYELTDINGDLITPNIEATLDQRLRNEGQHDIGTPLPSLKSSRTYNFGIVYGDKYGRETPVFTSDNANQIITKSSSTAANAIITSINNEHPSWADYYKVFVKETSNEYYNLAMGRVYDAEDNNVWISFPSIDRNKIDEDTYLILKKGVGKDIKLLEALVENEITSRGRYKVVAIENEAPEYIKTEYTLLAEIKKLKIHGGVIGFGGGRAVLSSSADCLIQEPAEGPYPGKNSFTLNKEDWLEAGDDLGDVASRQDRQHGLPPLTNDEGTGLWDTRLDSDIYVSFSNKRGNFGIIVPTPDWDNTPIEMSKKYRVTGVEIIPGTAANLGYYGGDLYRVTLAETIPQSDSWLTDYLALGGSSGRWNSTRGEGGLLRPHFYKKEVKNKPEFDGRFFVKIIDDDLVKASLRASQIVNEKGFRQVAAIEKLFHLKDGTGSGTTGQVASITRDHWRANLNYNLFRTRSNSRWFIDATAFAGVQPSTSNHPKESIVLNDNVDLCDVSSPTTYANIKDRYTDSPELQVKIRNWGTGGGSGLKKLLGAHTATYTAAGLEDETLSGIDAAGGNDKTYLSLSYSGINPSPNPPGMYIGSFFGFGGNAQAGTDHWHVNYYRDSYWNSHNDVKNWNVGESEGGPNPATKDQIDVVSRLTPNSLFRIAGDTTMYRITGVTKRKLYNFIGSIRWDDQYVINSIDPSEWWDESPSNNPYGYFDEDEQKKLLHGLGGFVSTYNDSYPYERLSTRWVDGSDTSGDVPAAVLNTVDPENLLDLVKLYNIDTLHLAGDEGTLYSTARHIQHKNITSPENCRLNYLIKYDVIPGTQPNGTAVSSPEVITDNLHFNAMDKDNHRRLEFMEEFSTEQSVLTRFPAIFETEPKEDSDLDIYYEATGKNPTNLSMQNMHRLIQIGAIMKVTTPGGEITNSGVFVTNITKSVTYANGYEILLSAVNRTDYYGEVSPTGTEIRFYNDDGSFAITNLLHVQEPYQAIGANDAAIFQNRPVNNTPEASLSNIVIVEISTKKIGLGWFNCWSFGNGVESNRIGDTYNKPFITNGVKASTTLLDYYGEERREYGLIYSGIYNSTSGVNNLNQFIAAEKITKDINPIYGSIQKLHSRSTADGDLIALCEDRVLKILANKDALFNADGNPQLTATNKVLGQAMPFSGGFGISKNPESFASESYRIYFTDKVRGTVMRLSKDGLTPISNHGMKDWFKDNLKLSTKLIGSYDNNKNEYNITLADRKVLGEELVLNGSFDDADANWTFADGASAASGVATNSSTEFYWLQQSDLNIIPGKKYRITFVSTKLAGHALLAVLGGSRSPLTTTSGLQSADLVAGTSDSHLKLAAGMAGGIRWTGTVDKISVREIISDPTTVSFKENVKGWVSFKSFFPENALSVANDYYSIFGSKLYQHHVETTYRNNFYGVDYNSSVNVIFNESPASVKSFHTLAYEGSQSKIKAFSIDTTTGLSDAQPYNLVPQDGWYVSGIETDKQVGNLSEFIEKEGKWFNYIKGVDSDITSETDFGAFDIQGIGMLSSISPDVLTFGNDINASLQVGDTIYFQTLTSNGAFDTIDSSGITKYGDVTAVTESTITVNPTGSAPVVDDYIMFAKNHVANTSSLLGYFADVKFENNSKVKAEIFSVGSEVTESSK